MIHFILLSIAIVGQAFAAGPKITIVIGNQAPSLERLAAENLNKDFATLFDAETTVQTSLPASPQNVVLLGSPASNPAIPAASWPKLSVHGIALKSLSFGLIVGGETPSATLRAASELSYYFGVRHLLQGDSMPIEMPILKLDGFDIVREPRVTELTWQGFNSQALGMDSWTTEEGDRLLIQLAKLGFTRIVLPLQIKPFSPIAVDGDSAGRTAFKGSKTFGNANVVTELKHLETKALELGLIISHDGENPVPLGAADVSVLPEFTLHKLALATVGKTKVTALATMPGDLNAAAYFLSRAAYDDKLTPEQALSELVTPICGEGVAERLQKGFDTIEKAAHLIATNDAKIGVPAPDMLLRHLSSKEPLPAWISEVKTLYASAMAEMYRGNTRARGGARPFILYHAKRLEFAMQYFTALEALYKAHDAAARGESLEAAVEAIYNGITALGDVARDPSDRGAIALMNEFGYRALLNATEVSPK
jgi:hypothetical protein